MVSKIVRYTNNFSDGGHRDSLDDNIVYSAMLEVVGEELRIEKKKSEQGKEENKTHTRGV